MADYILSCCSPADLTKEHFEGLAGQDDLLSEGMPGGVGACADE